MSISDWKEVEKREIVDCFKSLLRLNTSAPAGNEIIAASYLRDLLNQEGISSEIIESEPGRANLIAKLEGGTEPPALLISHLDVVSVDADMWIYPPFAAEEVEGVIYGRGALDTKNLVIMQLMSFIYLKRTGKPLNRDVYLIATADEEQGSQKGMDFLVRNYPNFFPQGLVFNEGGGFTLTFRDKIYMIFTAGEKSVCKVSLFSEGKGGHASCPPEDQAMGKMSEAIEKITSYQFPIGETAIGNRFLERIGLFDQMDKVFQEVGQRDDRTLENLLKYILFNAVTVNSVHIGERINVIPYKAEAEIEFRLLPGVTREQVEELLTELLQHTGVNWHIKTFEPGFESELDTHLTSLFQAEIKEQGLDATLLPIIALGRTDGRFIGSNGSQVYGFSPLLEDLPFSEVLKKVHNHNESITVDSLLFGTKVISEVLRKICMEL